MPTIETPVSSTSIAKAIYREMAEVVRIRKERRDDPRLPFIFARIDELARDRMELTVP